LGIAHWRILSGNQQKLKSTNDYMVEATGIEIVSEGK
jgi:hypothetical protein